MMSELLLDSIQIKNYRCFDNLRLEKLGRVNLLVGKNNVGKTAFLEALWIYSEASSWQKLLSTLNNILESRYEKEAPAEKRPAQFIGISDNVGLYFRHLFNQRPTQNLEFSVSTLQYPLDGSRVEVKLRFHDDTSLITSPQTDKEDFHNPIDNLFIRLGGLDVHSLTEIWDDVILRNEEDAVVESLKIILDELIDLNFISYPKGSEQRVPVVRTKDINERVPLGSLGEGMNRLLGLALALASCKKGILLVDEIESGLHYSVLPAIWRLIFKTARMFDIQVFATTHSRDCVEAFAAAAAKSPEDGVLIRLEKRGERIVAKEIEEEMLIDAVNYEVEVR